MTTQNEQAALETVISPIPSDDTAPVTEKATDDKLEKEITGKTTTTDEQFQIPDKFKGKSSEEIVQSYVELERDYGRRANEIGDLRRVNDQLLGLQLEDGKASDSSRPEKQPLTSDDILGDPESAINRVLNDNKRLDQIEKTLTANAIAQKKAQFDVSHPNGVTVVNSPEFQDWLRASSVRTNLFNYANSQFDYDVGGELIDLFEAAKGAKNETEAEKAAKSKKISDMKDMSMEKGSTGEKAAMKFYREDIIDLRLNNPTEYDRLYPEIFKAYQEGRVKNKRK